MKKNRMMRLASGLLVAVLITTSTISGTFAKYVTEAEASDSARVAKFGVVVTATGSLFDDTYINETGGNTPADAGELTVEASGKAVAPGTKNDTGITFTVTGTPEVDVLLKVEATATSDICLPDGKYSNMTTGDKSDVTTIATDYHPVVYKLVHNGTEYAGLTLDGLQAQLVALTTAAGKKYEANKDLSDATEGFGTFTITWEWPFGDPTNNEADTVLGDLQAGVILGDHYDGTDATVNTETATLTTSFNVSVSVEQID